MKVLIGYDGSACATDAIEDLRHAGLPDNTEVVVLSVADVFPPAPHAPSAPGDPPAAKGTAMALSRARGMAEKAIADATALSNKGADHLRSAFPDWTIRAEARADAPHWALVKMAAEWQADLVVVGSHGRSALGRVLLGSVSQQVLHNSPCSVRVSRCRPRRQDPAGKRLRLLVGVDGSAGSATAVSAMEMRAWPARTEVMVVAAVDSRAVLATLDPTMAAGGAAMGEGPDVSAVLEQAADATAESLRGAGLSAATQVVAGDPKSVLLSEAQQWDADCIFIGAKGHSRLDRLLIGSVSATIAARAHCSVEVVRTGW